MTLGSVLSALIQGLPNTVILLVASFFFASLFGMFTAWLNLREDPVARGVAKVYLGLIRGTPPLLMLLLAYYGLPKILEFFGIDSNNWAKLIFGILGLSVGWGAYLAEAFRSAYLSVDPGQLRAAHALGIPDRTAFRRIILPQAFLIAIPNIQNLVIGLMKATSLVYVIGISDMYVKASDISNTKQGVYQLQIFVLLALFYWLIALLVEWFFRDYQKQHKYIHN